MMIYKQNGKRVININNYWAFIRALKYYQKSAIEFKLICWDFDGNNIERAEITTIGGIKIIVK